MVLPVNRTVLLTHLEIAERYVDKGAQHIGRLKEIIDVLARGGADTTAPKDLLRQVETAQERYVAHRDWLLQELKNSTCDRLPAPLYLSAR
jgi:hypothetical protein